MQEISILLMLGIGKLSTVIYIRTANLLLSVHAIQLQHAIKVDREEFGKYIEVFLIFHRAYCTNLYLFELPTQAHCY